MGNAMKLKPRVQINLQKVISHLEYQCNSVLSSRADTMASMLDPEGRNLNRECGYPDIVTLDMYKEMFRSNGIAKKAVSLLPDETFQINPDIYETSNSKKDTPFEKGINRLIEEQGFFHYIHRADVQSGVGRMGLLLHGYDDYLPLDTRVGGVKENGEPDPASRKEREIVYYRVFDEQDGMIGDIETRPGPRTGMPLFYNIVFADSNDPDASTEAKRVHWSRVTPLVDNRTTSELVGSPRMEGIYDRLLDIRKIASGSAEMFWKGAFPGYSFETFPELAATGGVELDEESIKEQFQAYYNGLKRYLAIVGGSVKTLAPQVADPTNQLHSQLELIAISINAPLRIFTGSESGHLASTQDASTWNKRLGKRQMNYVNPMILRPIIKHYMMTGVLPLIPKYTIDWSDLNALSDSEVADIALKRTQALMQYTSGGVETVIPPMEYFVHILGFNPELAATLESMVKSVTTQMNTSKVWNKSEAPGISGQKSSAKKDKTKSTGRSRNAQG